MAILHERNYGEDLTDLDGAPVAYPVGFDDTEAPGGIEYLEAELAWKVPLGLRCMV